MELGAPALYAYTGGRSFDPAAPSVVFIHGAQHDHSVWALQSRYLAHRGYGVLAFDLPAHGRSRGPALTSVESMADRIAAACVTSGAQRMLIVGQSMGSLIALEVARRLPAQTRGVALVGTAVPMKVSEQLLAATRATPDAAMNLINVWSFSAGIGAFQTKPGNPGPGYSSIWQNLRLMQRIAREHGPEVLAIDFAACNAYQGGLEAARALRCPALLILGDLDVMTPPKATQPLIEALGGLARSCSVVRLGVGHSLMAEDPEGVRRALLRFAEEAFAPVAAA